MSNFNNKTITSKGLELLSSALAGNTLEFTRIVMGSGTYEGDIGLIESLVNQKQSLDIKSITRKGSQVVLSTTLLQNAIIEDFYWKEIGVYAKVSDGLEILYMYGSANEASYISKNMLSEKMINVGVLVSNAQNVIATIDESLLYISSKDLANHNNDAEAHSALRTWVQGLFNSLKLTWDNITGKPETFKPPVASTTILGGVKQGSNITIGADGTISGAAPYTHPNTHPASMITGLPTSLPANGGNADTVNGTHAWYMQTLSAAGATHGASEWLAKIQHNVDGDSYFKLVCGDGDIGVKVDNTNLVKGRDLSVELDNLKSTVVSGKQEVVNAINDVIGYTSGLTTVHSHADYAWWIRNMINTANVSKVASYLLDSSLRIGDSGVTGEISKVVTWGSFECNYQKIAAGATKPFSPQLTVNVPIYWGGSLVASYIYLDGEVIYSPSSGVVDATAIEIVQLTASPNVYHVKQLRSGTITIYQGTFAWCTQDYAKAFIK